MWPFSNAQLTAGLRRYFADSSIQVTGVREAVSRHTSWLVRAEVRTARVEYMAGSQPSPRQLALECVVKEPRGTLRVGLAGNGLREVGVYRSLAPQLPVQTPALIAADSSGAWLVLEHIPPEIALEAWTAADYQRAVRALAAVHERFWGLADDLAVYPWLARPLTSDFEIYVLSAVGAMEKMVVDNRPTLITGSLEVLTGLGQMLTQVEAMVARLRASPATLMHGDYRPRNISLLAEEEVVVFNWQLAGVAPGVLDLMTFINACRWERARAGGDLPIAPEALLDLYRAEMQFRVGVQWGDQEWAELLDHALMWCFTQDMLAWVASASPEDFARSEAAFRDIWLRPVLEAAYHRLRPVLYL